MFGGGYDVSWTDRAVLLTVAKVAKRTLVLEVMTENYGRCRAVATLEGKEAPVLLPGSFLNINCRSEGFGEPLRAELIEISGGIIAASPDDVGLLALAAAKDLMVSLLAEEDPAPEIYDAVNALMSSLVNEDGRWPLHYAMFEFALMMELGHVGNIDVCLPAFRHGEMIYFSPKTGKAVTREQAGAFLDRVIPLPGVLLGQRNGNLIEVRQGLELTEMLLTRCAMPAIGVPALPSTRPPLMQAFKRVRDIPKAKVDHGGPKVEDDARRKRLMSSKPLMVASRGMSGGV